MKTIIVTGSNSGIGKEAALNLAKSGHRILMLCRDSEKSTKAQAEIISQSGNENIILFPVDLAEPQSIRVTIEKIKNQYESIDVLVNNAGLHKAKREVTADGLEMTFAVNYLAPFMLSELLLENLAVSGDGRIVNVNSDVYKGGSINLDDLMMEKGYKAGNSYSNSKLANILNTIELAKRASEKGVTVNAMHPGVLATDVFRDYPAWIMKFVNLLLEKPEKGGERIVYLAISDEVKEITGSYFYKIEKKEFKISDQDLAKSERLRQIAEELTDIKAL